MNHADDHGGIARVLGELLAADVAFLLQPAEGRNHRGHQLEDDLRADIRHDAKGAHRALHERAAREHVVESHKGTAGAARLIGEEVLERQGIEPRQGDVGADARDE